MLPCLRRLAASPVTGNSLLTGKNTGNLRFLWPANVALLLSKLHILLQNLRQKVRIEQGNSRATSGSSFADGIPEQGMYLDLTQWRESELSSLFGRLKGTFLLTFSKFRSGGLGPTLV